MNTHTIRSRVARPQSFVIPHRPCCIARGQCLCRAGIPQTIQILQPHGSAKADAAALTAPDVIKAIARQEIEVVPIKASTAAVPDAQERPAARVGGVGRRSRG
jgi:hypothetical protein